MNHQMNYNIKTYLTLILIACVFAVSMLQSFRNIQKGQSIATEVTALDYWNASQARFELERAIGTLDAFTAGLSGVTAEDLTSRIDIFWSRLPLLYEGDQSRVIVELTDAEVVAPAIMKRIDDMSSTLQAFRPDDREAYAELHQTLLSFREPLNDIQLRLHHAQSVGTTTLNGVLESLYTVHAWPLAGAFVSSSLLVVVLLRSIRRVQKGQRKADEAWSELDAVMNALPLSVDVVDRKGRLLLLNSCAGEARGIDVDTWRGHRPEDVGRTMMMDERNRQVLADGQPIGATEIEIGDPEPMSKTWLVSKVPLAGQGGNVKKIITVGVDITAQKRAETRIRHLAHHDPLTGLPNRACLHEHLASALKRCERDHRQLALLSIDFDRFKEVNDCFGHQAGDRFLIKASERLTRCLPSSSMVARLGGDEFAVIQEHVASSADVRALATRLIDAFKEPIDIGEQRWFSTISLGASLSGGIGIDQQQLLKQADLALYEAKERGGNAVSLYHPTMSLRQTHRFGLQQDLREAIAQDELVLHYQPKVWIEDSSLAGYEALLRWSHPERGAVSPSIFIPAAEDCDLIAPLGELVLRKACTQLAAWKQDGFDPAPIAINVSAAQLLRQDLAGLIKRTLDETGVSPHLLELEVTESMLVEHSRRVRDLLSELRALELGITLDDFGTGYSSLGYLQSFPIDKLKIDKTFVQPIQDPDEDIAIIRAIVAMAHSLGIKVVAEGVETEAQHKVLKTAGCDQIQGYLISKPLPPMALDHWHTAKDTDFSESRAAAH